MEIEKKFTIKQLPKDLDKYETKEIEQGYLCVEPVIRIRKSNDSYYLTYKANKNFQKGIQEVALINEEIEVALTEESYLHLKEKVDFNIIEKTRYLIPLENNSIAELDVFHGKLEGLCFVEVEFKDEEEAKQFHKPEWFLEEVSFDKRFRNNYLITISSLDELGL